MEYDDCPATCAEGEKVKKNSFCDECPVKAAKENFKSFCEETLENACPDTWRKYGFDLLKQTLDTALTLEEMPRSDRTLITHNLIQEIAVARNRFEKIQRLNERPTK